MASMMIVSTAAIGHAPRTRFGSIASHPLWVALAFTAIVTAVRLNGTVDSDVAWQLWIGQRMLAGAKLYRDIVEINPPLWFWMALPVDKAASILHLRAESVLIIAMGGSVALSLALTNRLIRHLGIGRRALFLCYASLVLTAMPWMHVGQREQIALIAAVPYAALVAARRERVMVPTSIALLVGIAAGIGFALKHYFLLVPLGLEFWLFAGSPGKWRPFRPEMLGMASVAIAYALALVLFAQRYFTDIVPLAWLAYGDFGPPSLRYLLGPSAVAGLLDLTLLATNAGMLSGRKAPLTSALVVATLCFGGAYIVQFKGWPYHAIPFVGCASLALSGLLAECATPTLALRIISPALLLLPFALSARESASNSMPSDDLIRALSGVRPGSSVGFIAENSAVPWSITLQRDLRFPSRYMAFWMLGPVVQNQRLRSPNPRLTALGQQVIRNTVIDFECAPPLRIIALRPKQRTWNQNTLDPLAFFLRDADFAELFGHYRMISKTSIEVYQLASPLSSIDRSMCRQPM